MPIESLTQVVTGLLAALMLLFVWQYIWQATTLESFRQNIFTLRRELFLYMADGNIQSSHPAYLELRQTMNGMLRYAGRLTFGRALLGSFMIRRFRRAFSQQREKNFALIPTPEARLKLEDLQRRLSHEIGVYTLFKSSIFTAAVMFLVCALIVIIALPVKLFRLATTRKSQPQTAAAPERRRMQTAFDEAKEQITFSIEAEANQIADEGMLCGAGSSHSGTLNFQ